MNVYVYVNYETGKKGLIKSTHVPCFTLFQPYRMCVQIYKGT